MIFVFATAQPKGFALTLILGVLVSMLTAVLFTRAMLGVLAGFAFFSKPAFMGVQHGQIETAAVAEGRTAASRRAARRPPPVRRPPPTATPPRRRPLQAPRPPPPQSAGATSGRRTSTSGKKKKKRR